MKSPIEILKEKQRLERLAIKTNPETSTCTAAWIKAKLLAKIQALEWVLSEKP